MEKASIPTTKPDLGQVQKEFERWRRTRGKRVPIPDPLWQKAVDLCESYPVNKISRALRLNHTNLKSRVQQKASAMLPADPSLQFIEIDPINAGTPGAGCVVEMENRAGCRMKMYFSGKADLDLVELATAFWSLEK